MKQEQVKLDESYTSSRLEQCSGEIEFHLILHLILLAVHVPNTYFFEALWFKSLNFQKFLAVLRNQKVLKLVFGQVRI